ncbi:D-aminoacyl-tRNA deacylase [Denitromonas ohlonensis]|uniref:D-aminoacyl-tRNA deacylase n=2 Tax=Denitromonas TaxID=139331 RepID=A0A558CI62_9RHOO|nr:D-aminoacyl-tRNA deacylase [Denitromonas ohlonensis]TVT48455.1 MAG: D-tyrosyl-tRNA(Tyr) deacylase [Denitromonas halophila]TVO69470.1 D-tyrosyl-tRNA(Tyr) deacylase [Denitromonas ohlonensis]TVO77570.1 D-tyrosyl-tRNA(Tyr) deacylase [Denitromonas ohlonensis]TVT66571.1 MAG: D-tyrosyl-tRNA(Tyr) deacylase [Denitromonas halophila]TVT74090.1 MAG: D-tyrosyl-tRNA(Tyr) deacylase [Denitromonas halophila]
MIALIQRVTHAEVVVEGECVGRIDAGLLALIGIEPKDDLTNVARMAQRLLGYRVFQDADDRMNLSVRDVDGGLLLVPQFTLAADTRKGTRPGFSTAAPPDQAARLFDALVTEARRQHAVVETGRFGAEMHVSLTNHGPVTFRLDA